jgi:hypothetical protein
MNSYWLKGIGTTALVLVALSQTPVVFAQYVWLNENGIKQFSDIPPPSSIPKNRILKAPGTAPRTPSNSASAPAEAGDGKDGSPALSASAAVKDKAPMTTAEKNADFQKRKIELADKEKKAADEQKMAADRAKNCERARGYNKVLQSGVRVTTTDKNGERQYLNDDQRAQEVKDTRRILDDCK